MIYNIQKRRMISLITAVVMLFALAVPSFAHEVPDMEKRGTINITMTDINDRIVPGGTLTLYKVGDVHEDDGNYSFVLTEEFAPSNISLEDIESAELAEKLANYAVRNGIGGVTKEIDARGEVSFTDLELGLYLLVQHTPAPGYYKVNPFLVSVPQFEDGEYVYIVDASPKVEPEPKPDETETEPDETEPDETEPDETEPDETEPDETEPKDTEPKDTEPDETEPDETEPDETEPEETEPDETEPEETEPEETEPEDEEKLPQTGQLKWPIPVLVVAGLAFFLAGWVMKFKKKDSYDE